MSRVKRNIIRVNLLVHEDREWMEIDAGASHGLPGTLRYAMLFGQQGHISVFEFKSTKLSLDLCLS